MYPWHIVADQLMATIIIAIISLRLSIFLQLFFMLRNFSPISSRQIYLMCRTEKDITSLSHENTFSMPQEGICQVCPSRQFMTASTQWKITEGRGSCLISGEAPHSQRLLNAYQLLLPLAHRNNNSRQMQLIVPSLLVSAKLHVYPSSVSHIWCPGKPDWGNLPPLIEGLLAPCTVQVGELLAPGFSVIAAQQDSLRTFYKIDAWVPPTGILI